MTREEFVRWKHDGKEVWDVVRRQITQTVDEVAHTAGIDPLTDRYKAGVIRGMELVLEIEWEEEDVGVES